MDINVAQIFLESIIFKNRVGDTRRMKNSTIVYRKYRICVINNDRATFFLLIIIIRI